MVVKEPGESSKIVDLRAPSEAALISLAIGRTHPPPARAPVTGLIQAPYGRTGVLPSYRQRHDEAMVEALAESLQQLAKRPSPEKTVPAPCDGYIPRPALEEEFRALLRLRERLIHLKGDGGIGKSTLAKTFAYQYAPSDAETVIVDCGQPDETYRSILRVLARYGIEEPTNLVLAERRLASLLLEGHAPPVLILDNVESRDVITRLVPSDTTTVVIVTSRSNVLPFGRGSVLTIGAMTRAEALALAEARLPDTERGSLALLVKQLGNHPLAIEHACGYLRQPGSRSIDELIENLVADVAETLDCVARDEQSLTTIYRLTLEQLDSRNLRALVIIAALSQTWLRQAALLLVWPDQPEATPSPLTRMSVEKALSDLKSRSLIVLRDKPGSAELDTDGPELDVWMHSLTLRILRSLNSVQVAQKRQALLDAIEENSEFRCWRSRFSVPYRWLERTDPIRMVVQQLDFESVKGNSWAVAFAVRASYQMAIASEEVIDVALRTRDHLKTLIKEGQIEESHALGQTMSHEAYDLSTNETKCYELDREILNVFALNPGYWLAKRDDRTTEAFFRNNPRTWNYVRLLQGNEWIPSQIYCSMQEFTRFLEENISVAIERFRDLVAAGEHHQAKGTLHFDQAQWKEAEESFYTAYHYFKQLARQSRYRSSGFFIAEAIECTRRLTEVAIKKGRYDQAWRWFNHGLAIAKDQNAHPNIILWARWIVTMADIERNKLFVSAVSSEPPRIENWIAEAYIRATKIFKSEPRLAQVLQPSARYGMLCLIALEQPQLALQGMQDLAKSLTGQKWHFGVLRSNLAVFKLHAELIMRGETEQLPRNAASRVLSLAQKFQRKYQSPYWYADGLATAYALGLLSNKSPSWLEGVYAEAHHAAERIGRLDKLEAASKAAMNDFCALRLLAE